MSWFSVNFDLLLRACFALETGSQTSSEQKKEKSEQKRASGSQLNPLVSSSLKKAGQDAKCPLACPSPSEKTESILSLSTITDGSAISSCNSKGKPNESAPSYLDSSTCRKRRHRREISHSDVVQREGLDIEGILSTGRFGSSLLATFKKDSCPSSSDHSVVTLNVYHKSVLSETYQQHIPHREKELLASFDHPFIPSVLGSFSDRNCLYLICPVERGGPLSHVLQNALSHGITDKMKIFYAACVLSVLKYAHGQNVIHRGLHPDSLLIDGRGYLKVTDWGFAKVVTDRTYTLCGHVEYLCPEAIVQDAGYGKGADYWAFGVLIYHMFVGRSAYAPSSLDFKYDVKFDDRVLISTGANSTHGTTTTGSSHGKQSTEGVGGSDLTPTPSSSAGPLNNSLSKTIQRTSSSPLTGDTLDLQDPMGHDTGTIDNILTREPIYPSYMPHPTKSIVQGLCQKNMTQRLGTRRGGKGIEDIQKHIFFQDIEWTRLNKKLVQAPWVPTASSAHDSSRGAAPVEWTAAQCATHYPTFVKKNNVSDVELCGPKYTGYNCPDWNSFV